MRRHASPSTVRNDDELVVPVLDQKALMRMHT